MPKKGGTYVCWKCGLEMKCMNNSSTISPVICCGEAMKMKIEQRGTEYRNRK